MKFYETEQFKKLSKEWREKLRRSGFKDIENCNGWIESSIKVIYKYSPEDQHYYELTQDLLHRIKFPSKTHEKIWSLYSEGVSVRQIAKIISEDDECTFISKSEVHRIIRFYHEHYLLPRVS